MSPPDTFTARLRRLAAAARDGRAATAAVLLVAAGLIGWAWLLWPQWRANPDLAHGYFALPLLVLLWRRAAEDAARPGGEAMRLARVVAVALALIAVALLAAAYVASAGWSEPICLFLLSVAAGLSVALAGLLAAGPSARWIGSGWAWALMPLVLALSAPPPPVAYGRLTAGLQEGVTVAVVETLRLVGLPAMRQGNIIHLGAATVGVEEACSGVRSLISCVLVALVLSGLWLRTPWRRVLLLACAVPLALATNFARSLALTLLARSGVDIAGFWHDGLGLAVLATTTAALGGIAHLLEEEPRVRAARPAPGAAVGRVADAVGLAALGLTALGLAFVAVRTSPPGGDMPAPPALAALVPAAPTTPGWAVVTRGDLDRFSGVLQTDALIERSYVRRVDETRADEITVYLAYWAPGASTVGAVAVHTPDACWPGAGWTALPERTARVDLGWADGPALLGAEQRGFAYGGSERLVWYWHLAGGEPVRPFEPRSWRALLGRLWREGVPPARAQVFARVSSNLDAGALAREPLFAELASGLKAAGVPVAPR